MELGTREAGARQRKMQKKYSVEFILYRLQKSTTYKSPKSQDISISHYHPSPCNLEQHL